MQGKGIIKFFLIALTIVCLLQYFYYLPTNKVEKAAAAYATKMTANVASEDKDAAYKIARVEFLDSMSSEPIFNIPFVKSYTYDDLKGQQLALGLDLKGGMSTILQVDLKNFVLSLSDQSKDPTFLEALGKAEKRIATEPVNFVTAFGEEWAKIANGKKLYPIFSKNPTMKSDLKVGDSDSRVLQVLTEKGSASVDLTFKMLKDRIDKFGVTQPNVSLDASRDLIVVELPGIDNPERARKFLQASAKLEFWDVYRISDPGVFESFKKADDNLKILLGDSSVVVAPTSTKDTIWEPKRDSSGNIIDSTMKIVDVPAAPQDNYGPLLKNIQMNGGTQEGGMLFSPAVMGQVDKNKIKLVGEYLNRPDIKALFPQDMMFRFSDKAIKNPTSQKMTNKFELYALRVPANGKAPLEGDRVTKASEMPDPRTNQVSVSLEMDGEGARKWAEMTTKAAADNNREIAILLDDQVVSAPRVNDPITSGNSSISGDYTVQEAKDLANILEVGKLPAGTKIIQESLVGPSLGAENIGKSVTAILVGMLFIMIFMISYFSSAGVIAVLALLANMFFIFGILASQGTVLTLPGIAGIVLTMGIAVDVCVIIFERIKEELENGHSLQVSIVNGFKHSYSAIIDANVVTILTNIVLAYFGLGPVKGFAVVMIIGVLTALFTAVLVGRMIIDWWVGRGGNLKFSTPLSERLFHGSNINWMGLRKKAYIFSISVTVVGLVSMFTRGFELGVDMKGGYSYNVAFDQSSKVSAEDIRKSAKEELGVEPIVKAVDVANTYNITTSYKIDDNGDNVSEEVLGKIFNAVKKVIGKDITLEQFTQADGKGTHLVSFSKVGPTVADDIRSSSILAALLALAVIFVYILLRFSKWQYSMGALVALVHDAFFTLSIFSLLHGIVPWTMEIDQAFIAAILTIIGYSMNDTVIIFDRIREFAGKYLSESKTDVINSAINSTLGRTLVTSFITFMVMLILFIFGGSSIKGFSFAILVGIIIGTYSSIFIAGAIVHDLSSDIRPKTIPGHLNPIHETHEHKKK